MYYYYIMNISKLVNSNYCYNFLNKYVPYLFNDNYLILHNTNRLKYFKPSENTFEGRLCCGAVCYTLDFILKKNNIDTKLMIKEIGYGKYKEDHCFLLTNNNYIIDPTYRQFFTNNKNINSYYNKYLFDKCPFIFVGKYIDLINFYNKLSLIHYSYYKYYLSDKNMIFYKDYKISDIKLDFCKVVNSNEYAKYKGKYFYNLNKNFDYSDFSEFF